MRQLIQGKEMKVLSELGLSQEEILYLEIIKHKAEIQKEKWC
jgi:hypothetical protein